MQQWQHAAFCSRCAIAASGTASGAWLLDPSGRRLCQHCFDATESAAAAEGPSGAGAAPQQEEPAIPTAVQWFTATSVPSTQVVQALRISVLGVAHAGSCQLLPSQCSVPGCSQLKASTDHAFTCDDLNCRFPGCALARAALLHSFQCTNVRCPICGSAGLHLNDTQALRRLVHKFAAGSPMVQKWPHLLTRPMRFLMGGGVPQPRQPTPASPAAAAAGGSRPAVAPRAQACGVRQPPLPLLPRKRGFQQAAEPEQMLRKAPRLTFKVRVAPQPAHQVAVQRQPATASPSAPGTSRPAEVACAGGSQPSALPAPAALQPPSPPRHSERAAAAQQEQAAAHTLLQLRETQPIVVLLLDTIKQHPHLTTAAGLTQRLVGEYAALRLRLAPERRAELEARLRDMLERGLYGAAASLMAVAMWLTD